MLRKSIIYPCRDKMESLLCKIFSRNFIIILGCQRSGTTLIFMMLATHSRISGVDEKESSYQFPASRELLINYLRNKRTCYKLPTKTSMFKYINECFPNSKILWIVRHPYSVISSMRSLIVETGVNWIQASGKKELKDHQSIFPEIKDIKLNQVDEISLAAYIWKYKMMSIDLYKKNKFKIFIIKYEDLLSNPRKTMEQVLTFVGIPWDEKVLHHEEYLHDKIYFGNNRGDRPLDTSRKKPKLNLSMPEKDIVTSICKKQMAEYGYEPTPIFI